MPKIIKNSLYSILTWIMPIVFTFILIPIAKDRLGVSTYGVYLMITTVVGFISMMNFGTAEALINKLSALNPKVDYKKINEYLNASILITIISSVFIMILTICFSSVFVHIFIKNSEGINAERLLVLTALSSCIFFVTSNILSFFKAIQKYNIPSYLNVGYTILQNVLMIAFLKAGYGIDELIYSMLFTNIVLLILSVVFLYVNYRKYRFGVMIKKTILSEIINFSKYSFLVGILNIILLNSDKLFISYFYNESAVTYYSVPSNLSIKIQQFIGVALNSLYPQISLYYHNNDINSLKNLYKKTFNYLVIFVLCTSIPAVMYSGKLMYFWMGSDFAIKSTLILRVSILAYELLAFSAIPYFFFYGMNKPGKNFIFSMLSGSLTIIFNIIFIPKMSGLGAALATLISCAACFIALNSSRKMLDISYKFLLDKLLSKYAIPVVCQVAISVLLLNIINNLLMVFLAGFISVFIFVIAYVKFGDLDEEEKKIVGKFFKTK